MPTHLLLGQADESGHFTVNAGSDDFEDYVIDLPDGIAEFDEIQVNAGFILAALLSNSPSS